MTKEREMEVLLIRHGDPDYTNDCLTDTGRAEARCLAAALADLPIASVYVGETIPEGCAQFALVQHGFDTLLGTHGYARDGELYRVQRPSAERIAIFCHKGVILTLLADVLHWPLAMIFVSLEIHTTGVTRLKMVENAGLAHFKATAINDVTHLRTHAQRDAGHGG